MTRHFVGTLAMGVSLLSLSVTAAQQSTSRLEREIEKSRPRAESGDETRRQAQNENAAVNRTPTHPYGDRYLKMPQGYYTIAPDRHRPDNWSPRLRPQFDYGPRALGSRSQEIPSYRYREIQNSGRYRYGYFGASWASDCYGCGSPFCTAGSAELGNAYIQGAYDADHEYMDYIAAERAGRLLDANRLGVSQGIEHFRAGRYERAAIEWLGASERNQGDAASRVHAGHALFAIGRYDEAVKLLARAFELAPYLTESYFDVRTEYRNPIDFPTHLATLKAYVARHPHSASAVTLLAYVTAYTDGPAAASVYIERANRLNPGDFFVQRLLKISRLVTPMPGVVRTAPDQLEPTDAGRMDGADMNEQMPGPAGDNDAEFGPAPSPNNSKPGLSRQLKQPAVRIQKAVARSAHD
ncbi:MAG: CDC27 family protein [Phycisphaerae bacterium]|nr:CDC27 family protein [Phycisphaerae bacterium]